eukprot:5019626-Prymnesium_polylepis.3
MRQPSSGGLSPAPAAAWRRQWTASPETTRSTAAQRSTRGSRPGRTRGARAVAWGHAGPHGDPLEVIGLGSSAKQSSNQAIKQSNTQHSSAHQSRVLRVQSNQPIKQPNNQTTKQSALKRSPESSTPSASVTSAATS